MTSSLAVSAGSLTEPRDPAELARLAKAHAFALGFDLVGITALGPVQSAPLFDEWIAAGRAGTMHYLERGAEKRHDSRLPKAGTTHAVVVGLDYGGGEPSGPVARATILAPASAFMRIAASGWRRSCDIVAANSPTRATRPMCAT